MRSMHMDDKLSVSKDKMNKTRNPKREVAISKLQHAIDVGRSSGPAIPFDPVLFKQKMRKTHD